MECNEAFLRDAMISLKHASSDCGCPHTMTFEMAILSDTEQILGLCSQQVDCTILAALNSQELLHHLSILTKGPKCTKLGNGRCEKQHRTC